MNRSMPGSYRWDLNASTTTSMSAEEIHELDHNELRELCGHMDAILKDIGYTQSSVDSRMTALAEDRKYQFAKGDPGRAEMMAFIQK